MMKKTAVKEAVKRVEGAVGAVLMEVAARAAEPTEVAGLTAAVREAAATVAVAAVGSVAAAREAAATKEAAAMAAAARARAAAVEGSAAAGLG